MPNKLKNIDSLDFLKSIASILIVFHHYQQDFSARFNGINFFGGRIYFGYLVELFFMISGYLTLYTSRSIPATGISQILKEEGRAFIHKLKRIYPMTIITTAFCLCVLSIDAAVMGDTPKLAELWNLKAVAANFLLLFRGWPGLSMMGYNNPLWYLCILIQCYILFYLIKTICELSRNLKLRYRELETLAWLVIIIFITFFRRINPYSYRGFQSFGAGLIFCTVVNTVQSKFMPQRSESKKLHRLLTVLLCTASVLSIVFSALHSRNQREILMIGVYLPILALALIHRNWENKIGNLMGKTSFELFIWHYPMTALLQLVFHIVGIDSFRHSYLTMLVFTAAVQLWAWFIYTQLEIRIAKTLE